MLKSFGKKNPPSSISKGIDFPEIPQYLSVRFTSSGIENGHANNTFYEPVCSTSGGQKKITGNAIIAPCDLHRVKEEHLLVYST